MSPGGSIQAGIDRVAVGYRVLVQPGTYVETIDFRGKAIAVVGVGGAARTTIDGGGSAPVVRFATGEGPGSRLQGLTITGGRSSSGPGGIVASGGATPSIEDCIVHTNSGRFGGGIAGTPTLRRCVVHSNTASLTHGGGIYGAPQMQYCVVAYNRATSANGGGIYVTGAALIEDCVFLGNGAVFANSKGGGIYVQTSSPVTVRRCLVAGNFATGGAFAGVAGGIFAGSNASIEGCTVVDNSLTGSSINGGGIYGAATVVNTIVRGNAVPQLSAFTASAVTYCDLEGISAGIGCFDAVPGFVDANAADYHLDHGSPCIDTGDPARFDPDGSRSDVGAYPFETLYTHVNTSDADLAVPSWPEVSVVVGGRQVMHVLVGSANAGQLYLTAGSLSGTTPGFSFAGWHVPLNPDAYLTATVSTPNTPLLANSFGSLDAGGRGTTTFTLPGQPGATYAGTMAAHASLVLSPAGAILAVSNPLTVQLVR